MIKIGQWFLVVSVGALNVTTRYTEYVSRGRESGVGAVAGLDLVFYLRPC